MPVPIETQIDTMMKVIRRYEDAGRTSVKKGRMTWEAHQERMVRLRAILETLQEVANG